VYSATFDAGRAAGKNGQSNGSKSPAKAKKPQDKKPDKKPDGPKEDPKPKTLEEAAKTVIYHDYFLRMRDSYTNPYETKLIE
jgi:hypothetical protein